MSRSSATAVVIGLALCACASASLAAQAPLSAGRAAAIGDSVRQTLAAFSAIMARGRWDSAGAFYSNRDDFRWVEEGKVVAHSAGDIRKYLQGMSPKMRITTSYSDIETAALAPGVASVITAFSTTMGDSGSAGFTFAGELSLTLIHEKSGWVILNGHSSAPHERRE